MEHEYQPYRSVLYMPGSRPRALERARHLPADALILDLEDAVAPTEKPLARELVAEAVETGGYGARRLIIRVNGLDTQWGRADLVRSASAGPHAILLPKVDSPADLLRAIDLMEANDAPEHTRVWAMIETPRAILSAATIAGTHPRLQALVLGTNDLAKDLGAAHTPDRVPLLTSLGLCLLAARAEGLLCFDGVHNAFKDLDGLRAACIQARDMGFDGKTLIHPDQVETANMVFAPSPEDLKLARAQVDAYESARARGEGVAVLDGKIVENLHVDAARRLIARAAAIEALADGS